MINRRLHPGLLPTKTEELSVGCRSVTDTGPLPLWKRSKVTVVPGEILYVHCRSVGTKSVRGVIATQLFKDKLRLSLKRDCND